MLPKRCVPIVLVVLCSLLGLINPKEANASGLALSDCSQPVILYTEYYTEDDNELFCVTAHGPKNLGLRGWGFALSPSMHYLAYYHEQGPNHQNGNERFGDQTLFILDMTAQVINSWHTGYGNITYWWLDNTHLLISRWIDNLGSYAWEYPSFYITDEQAGTIRQTTWVGLRFLAYVPAEKRLIFSDWNKALFTTVLTNENVFQPFYLPDQGSPYAVAVSSDGGWAAYDIDNYSVNNCSLGIEIVDRRTNNSYDLGKAACNDEPARVNSFSDDGKFLLVDFDGQEQAIGVYRLFDHKLIFYFNGSINGPTEAEWLHNSDTLILLRDTTRHFTTDLYSFDAATQRLKRLTSSLSTKDLP